MDTKEKIKNLFSYMLNIKKMNENIVRDIRKSEKFFGIADIPQIEGVSLNNDKQSDVWIEITKQRIVDPPEPCEKIRKYIKGGYENIEKEPEHQENCYFDEKDGYIQFEQNKDIVNIWNNWIKQWRKWKESTELKYKVQKLYDELFKIYLILEKSGENLEIIYGNGILCWNCNEEKIVHPVFTTKMELNFDSVNGKFYLKPYNNNISYETDMLNGIDLPNMDKIINLKHIIKEQELDIRESEQIKPFLNEIVHYLSPHIDQKGEFCDQIIKFNEIKLSKNPVFYNSPIVALRKKDTKIWIAEINNIISKIDENYKIPKTINALIVDKEIGQTDKEIKEWKQVGQDLLFPLEANEDQKEIARRLATNYGVVVQGPPGTGKSHTIANLICHLLAHGKRVLVTSETDKALRVLADKIPEEIRSLCVSVLGNDNKSLQELDESIRNIANNLSLDKYKLKEEIKSLQQQLDLSRREKAKLYNQIRELETEVNKDIKYDDNNYKIIDIAKWIKENENKLSYIKDEIQFGNKCPLDEEQIREFLYLLESISKEDIILFTNINSIIEKIPTYEKLVHMLESLKKLECTNEQDKKNIQNCIIENYYLDFETIIMISKEAKKVVENLQQNWLENIMKYYYSSEVIRESINNFVKKIKKYLNDITKIQGELSSHSIENLENIDIDKFEKDFHFIYKVLYEKGKIGAMFKIFHSGSKYILEQCKVDGKCIENIQQAELIKKHIDLKKTMIEIVKLWNVNIKEYEGLQIKDVRLSSVAIIEDNLKQIQKIIEFEKNYKSSILNLLKYVKIQKELNWNDKETYDYIQNLVISIQNIKEYNEINIYIEKVKSLLKEKQEDMQLFITGINKRDLSILKRQYDQIERIKGLKKDIVLMNRYSKQLSKKIPLFVGELYVESNSGILLDKYKNFHEAWKWAEWNFLLNKLNKFNSDCMNKKLKQENKTEKSIIRELVAKKTWYEQINRITEIQKRSLFAWLESVKKIGKGTGKFANIYRKTAQKEMETCKDAIPVWIMPLNRVVENLKISDDLFDVVIFDESSQSDIFAITALFRAKKAIIVGDDKQISPQAVGKNISSAHEFMYRYLRELPHYEMFDLQTSLYSTALRIFPNRLMLKEHFRCVPEIIQFSNDLCYGGQIIPLRLPMKSEVLYPPVVAVKVVDGYKEDNRQINKPEAEAIVNKIVECCKDDKYVGMSMGVISLLGDVQAELIQNLLRERLTEEEILNRNIICGDAYSFQGDERDIIFLSMVVAPNARFNALTKGDDIRRFNVAASRARNQMWLFCSVEIKDLNPKCIRYRLLKYCQNPVRINNEIETMQNVFDSEFEKKVYKLIRARGYAVTPQVKVGRYRIDLVVEGIRKRLAVECDGDRWHGIDRWEHDHLRQMNLERVGWTFVRIRGSEFYRNPSKAMEKVWEKLDEMEIEV